MGLRPTPRGWLGTELPSTSHCPGAPLRAAAYLSSEVGVLGQRLHHAAHVGGREDVLHQLGVLRDLLEEGLHLWAVEHPWHTEEKATGGKGSRWKPGAALPSPPLVMLPGDAAQRAALTRAPKYRGAGPSSRLETGSLSFVPPPNAPAPGSMSGLERVGQRSPRLAVCRLVFVPEAFAQTTSHSKTK